MTGGKLPAAVVIPGVTAVEPIAEPDLVAVLLLNPVKDAEAKLPTLLVGVKI